MYNMKPKTYVKYKNGDYGEYNVGKSYPLKNPGITLTHDDLRCVDISEDMVYGKCFDMDRTKYKISDNFTIVEVYKFTIVQCVKVVHKLSGKIIYKDYDESLEGNITKSKKIMDMIDKTKDVIFSEGLPNSIYRNCILAYE